MKKFQIEKSKICGSFRNIIQKHWLIITITGCILACAVLLFIYRIMGIDFFRLDQYAETICTTTAGVIGTMFGLTAASYAFCCGNLRSESQEKPHLQKILEVYMGDLWCYFIYSLILTVITILSSLLILTNMQQFTSSISYTVSYEHGRSIISYFTHPATWLGCAVGANVLIASVNIFVMANMNRSIFKREERHVKIASDILVDIGRNYTNPSMKLPQNDYDEEYEKIHNLEIVVKRILKNHESMGEAFSEELRRRELLSILIVQTLNNEFHMSEGTKDEVPTSFWENLSSPKRENRWIECVKMAQIDYNGIRDKKQVKYGKSPEKCDFIQIYDDMLTYRDCKLVMSSNCRQNMVDIFDGRPLRYAVKKRILWFYLYGEEFTNMDLSRISFSGADLRNTNFAGSNLTKVRLKGANCQGADFSRTKLSGMYFSDAFSGGMEGEVQLTCCDDSSDRWDPYKGREITNLKDATFNGADVSRAHLDASQTDRFSLEGTNFDNAKLFFSFFKNISLNNASLGQSQLYNSALLDVEANSTNFSGSVMTSCCIANSNFRNANFEGTSLVETVLYDLDFTGAKLIAANFAYSNICGCNFDETSCQNVSFKNIEQKKDSMSQVPTMKGITIDASKHISFRLATLTRTDFSGANLDNIVFENVMGSECIFSKVKATLAIFDRAMLLSSVFNNAIFKACSFNGTILRNSIINDSLFVNCDFNGTDFSGTLFDGGRDFCFVGGRMCNVIFSNCQGLRASCFKNCSMKKVDFTGTTLHEIDFLNCTCEECIFDE